MGSRRRREREQQEMWLEFQAYQHQRCANCPIYLMFNDMLRQQQIQGQPVAPAPGPAPGAAPGAAPVTTGQDGQGGFNLGNLGGLAGLGGLGGLNTNDLWKTLNLPPELDMLRRLLMSRTVNIPRQAPMPGPFAPMAGQPGPMAGPPGPMPPPPQPPRSSEDDEGH